MPFSRKYSGFGWILAEFPDNLPLDVETFRSSVPISCGLRGIFANLSDIRRVVNVDTKSLNLSGSTTPKSLLP
jgi:hypothetical protein